MKKSRSISVTLMAGLAAACGGEDPSQQSASAEWGGKPAETRVCADSSGLVVPDAECARPRTGGVYPFLYYYGASRMLGPGGSTYIRGGTASAAGVGTGRMLPPVRGPVSRGGFGTTARGRAGSFGG